MCKYDSHKIYRSDDDDVRWCHVDDTSKSPRSGESTYVFIFSLTKKRFSDVLHIQEVGGIEWLGRMADKACLAKEKSLRKICCILVRTIKSVDSFGRGR